MAKKNITITLYLSELVYDIQNKTFLTGRSRNNGKNHEEVADMQANDDDEDINQVLRSIQNAWANLKTKLSEWLVESGTTATNKLIDGNALTYYKASNISGTITWNVTTNGTDIANSKGPVSSFPTSGVNDGDVYAKVSYVDLQITLQMPSNFNQATNDTVAAACHQYIVNLSIAEWFNMTNKADAGDYAALSNANLEQIREAANKRVRPKRTEV